MLNRAKNKSLLSLFSVLSLSQSSLADTIFPDITYQSLQTGKPINITSNTNSSTVTNSLSKQETLSEVRLINDSTLTIDDNKFYAYATTNMPGTGQINFKVNNAISSSLGSATQPLGLVVFDNNTRIYGNSYVKVIEIAQDTTVTFNNNINAKPGYDPEFVTTKVEGGYIDLTGIRATAVFGEGSYIGSAIRSDISGQGAVRFTGNGFVNKIGENANSRIDRVTFYVPNTIGKLNDDIYARTMSVDNVTLDINENIIVDIVNYKGSNQSIKLNNNSPTFRGNFQLTGVTTIQTIVEGDNIGNIIVDGDTTKLDMSAANLVINLSANNASILAQNGTKKTYTLFNSTNNGVIIPSGKEVTFNVANNYNRYIKWSYDPGTYTILLENNLDNLVADVQNSGADPAVAEFAQILTTDPNLSSDALELLNTAANMPPDQAAILLDNTIPDLLSTEEVVDENNAQVNKSYFSRMTAAIVSFKNKIFGEEYGVAAGDEADRYGAWIAPFYGQSVQKTRKLNDGYKTRNYGATLGFDTKINDELSLGLGVSHIHSILKNIRNYVDDKGKVNTYIFSLYGQYDLPQNWFVQGIASYGQSFIKNTETRKINPAIVELAEVKYKTRNYGTQLLLGNNYDLSESFTFTPMIGLRYDRFSGSRYKETGTSNEHLSVYKKAVNRVEGTIGAKLNTLFKAQKVTIAPEIHGFINNNFTNKKPVTITTLDGLSSPLPSRAEKPERLSYDLGAGVNMEYKNMELGLVHEIELERKFVAHQTMLKLKINF